MKKLKIFIYHFIVFILGSVGLALYAFANLKSSVGGAIAMPVIAFVYIVGFGILCLISFTICLLVSYLRNRQKK